MWAGARTAGESERGCVALPGMASRRCIGKAKAGCVGISASALAVARARGACLLLLRGPQTPGELSGRLHSFADNDAVEEALDGLIERPGDPLVVKLPRTPGLKDSEYMHLFSGPVDIEAHAARARAVRAAETPERVSVSELTQRIVKLEAEVAELKEQTKMSS